MEKKKNIFIVSGEPSGDFHASELAFEIQKLMPGSMLWGMGGANLRRRGVETVADLTGHAVVGFWEVVRKMPEFSRAFRRLIDEAEKRKPDCAILVDYPGFNLKLAARLKAMGIPVVYYISPQVWAWGTGRIRTIRKTVDKVLVLFPFERELYRSAGVNVSFVGHPLLDEVRPAFGKEELGRRLSLDSRALTVSLLPGSRKGEVSALLPVMMETCRTIREYFADRVQFLVLGCESLDPSLFTGIISRFEVPVKLVRGMYYESLAASDFALVCSGTATLETAVAGTPMVILYKTSLLTWMIARPLIRIPYIGLTNVVAGKKVAEEFIQFDCRPDKIADMVVPLLRDPRALAEKKLELDEVRRLLGETGASARAAAEVASFLGSIKRS